MYKQKKYLLDKMFIFIFKIISQSFLNHKINHATNHKINHATNHKTELLPVVQFVSKS